ncbi:MAG: hypothetical protein GWM98_22185, partial [Nitrospinaceae bacterium]|nr:hypothetical protein [Nitrospinaceae bacterium]NIR56667.1 hypothetical protein [Nitrospinaceae bacterium]NIS87130.1 hypothetical protein [Nitrospinaceae bacterium]NIT83984.1 hypothetical protein [Nitrospinaceae bacterium]NIU46174.1 hypothetical protein [Nitrospinaceae bacterium]
ATCFLLGSLYFLTRGETTKGAAFLVLASLCRPESFVLIAFIAGYALWQWKKKEMPAATLRGVLVFLALPPLFWLAANFLKTGDALYAFQVAQSYTQNTGQSYSGSDFPRHFLQLLSTYYYPVLGLAISAAGFVLFIRKFRSLMFLYVYLVLSILGYWVLAPFNIPLLERYLLPITVYLIVFGVLLCRDLESRWSRPGSSEKQGFAPAALLPALLVPVYLHLPAHTAVNQIINYHKVFDADIPKVADHFRAEIAKRDRSRMKIMVSSRREGQLNYLLYDQLPRLSISSIRQIYFNESDLAREQAEWVVYAPDDFYPLKSAFYMFDLLSAEGLKKQGIQVGESQRISEHTQLLHLTR